MLAVGEWWCGHCGIHNYRGNLACFSCKAMRRVQESPKARLADGFKHRPNKRLAAPSTMLDHGYTKGRAPYRPGEGDR